MAQYRYATQEKESARAVALEQHVSTKQAIEIANWIRGRSLTQARSMLQDVVAMRRAVPYRRFNHDVGHRAGPGITSGRFPHKTAGVFLKLLKELQANAGVKGMDEESLKIDSVVVNRASGSMHHGRQRGRQFKNTHIEMVVVEQVEQSSKKSPDVSRSVKKPVKDTVKSVSKESKDQTEQSTESVPEQQTVKKSNQSKKTKTSVKSSTSSSAEKSGKSDVSEKKGDA